MVSVVPNPTVDEADLILARSLERSGFLALYDALGAEVLTLVVPSDQSRMPFSTAALIPGLYHFAVRSNGLIIGAGKLSIIR